MFGARTALVALLIGVAGGIVAIISEPAPPKTTFVDVPVFKS